MAIKCLSLYQPWASLLAHGQKKIETRSWFYRGPMPCIMAIHAAKKWDAEISGLCRSEPFKSALLACGCRLPTPGGFIDPGIPLGKVVGLARLIGCCRTDWLAEGRAEKSLALAGKISDEERAFGDYNAGRYGWVFDAFHPLTEPIPLRGQQGVWDWDAGDDVESLVKAVWPETTLPNGNGVR
jgi:hypothetical protein